MTTAFDRWYSKNAGKLSEKRKTRYHSDPTYRQQAKDRAAKARSKKPQVVSPNKKFGEVAELLEVSTVTLRSWKSKDYYPEPRREGRYVVFTTEQVDLLIGLREVFVKHLWNMKPEVAQTDLENTVRLIYANWR